jgi:hypothetical protein
MKPLLLFILLLFSVPFCRAQLVNGSFENPAGPSLSAWTSTCGALSEKGTPDGGGDYCIRVFSGNTQGCWPGFAYQKLPQVTNGQAFALSGWVYALTSPWVGLFFGKISKGEITLLEGDTTSSTSWKELSIQSEFLLAEGDTAVVVLWGGLTGGPVQGYGFFDRIGLQQISVIRSIKQETSLTLFPNPFSYMGVMKSGAYLDNATILIYNAFGQLVRKITGISGYSIPLVRDQLPAGLYVIRLIQRDSPIKTLKFIIDDDMMR